MNRFLNILWIMSNGHPNLLRLLSFVYNALSHNRMSVKGRENKLQLREAFIVKVHIAICGSHNHISLGKKVRMHNCTISISGNHHRLVVEDNTYIENLDLHFEDDYCEIRIGKRCNMSGGHFAVAESHSTIFIGNDCLFSKNIDIVTTDSHSIFDCDTNKRINQAKSIVIGNKVWMGEGSCILKGVTIPDHCVVARKALVTKSISQSNCIIGGIPSRIIKENIYWKPERNQGEGEG